MRTVLTSLSLFSFLFVYVCLCVCVSNVLCNNHDDFIHTSNVTMARLYYCYNHNTHKYATIWSEIFPLCTHKHIHIHTHNNVFIELMDTATILSEMNRALIEIVGWKCCFGTTIYNILFVVVVHCQACKCL